MTRLHSGSVVSESLFDQEELKILEYLRKEQSVIEERYLKNISKSRSGILNRLLQAVVRENLLPSNCVTWKDGEEGGILHIQLSNEKELYAKAKKKHLLGMFDLEGEVFLLRKGQSPVVINHPVELLDLLKNEACFEIKINEKQFNRFRAEVQNSTANYALALAGAEQRTKELESDCNRFEIKSSLGWIQHKVIEDPWFSPLTFYEQWVVDGHTMHPCSKTKFGLDVFDVIKFSPEWGGHPEIALAAVHKTCCHITSLNDESPTAILYKEYPGLKEHIAMKLHKKGLNESDYELIPVHPWQLEHTLPFLHGEAVQNNEVIPISDFTIKAAALVSFRSLAPIQKRSQQKHHIKTAVNVQTTSAVRTVSPASTINGPNVSRLIREIQHREHHFDGTFIMLEEKAGIYYNPLDSKLSAKKKVELGKNLASILRENPENHLKEGEVLMPAAALIAKSPVSNKYVIEELIEQFAGYHNISNRKDAAVSFIERYAKVALPGFLKMMSRYGISLEGHLQNSVPVFKNGELVKMIIRDYGGIRILNERLAKQQISISLASSSTIVTEDGDELRTILSHAVFQNHLGELIACLVRSLKIKEELLWSPVAKVCKQVFNSLKLDVAIKEQTAEDERALFKPTIDLKALATMRLLDDITDYTYTKVPNPLNKVDGGE